MKIIDKIKLLKNGCKELKICVCGIPVLSGKKSPFFTTLKICGIPIESYKNKSTSYKKEKKLSDITKFINYTHKRSEKNGKQTLLWIDHSLYGGTETYSFNKFIELKSTYTILRLQYNAVYNCFIFSIPNEIVSYTPNFEEVKSIISALNFSEICINSIFGYPNPKDLLTFCSSYKKRQMKTKISFRGHDFYSLCPSYNLLNCYNTFCNLTYKNGCKNCIEKIKIDSMAKKSNDIFFYDFENIDQWHKIWEQFFTDTLDEIIVFSNSTKDLFIKIYPVLNNKIKIIPHKTQQLSKVTIKEHLDINIAVLGNIDYVHKGHDVIDTMCKKNNDPNIKLIVIGSFKEHPKDLIVTGKYKPLEIPNIIEKYNIDIVFIPSIWPETFSYTTSEAMSMDIPVACYNIGAPTERVSKYKKGLVLDTIAPEKNLIEIKEFVLKLRNTNKSLLV